MCPLSCHLGLAPASVVLGAGCCPAGLLPLRGGERKWTVGFENLCVSGSPWCVLEKGFLPEEIPAKIVRYREREAVT